MDILTKYWFNLHDDSKELALKKCSDFTLRWKLATSRREKAHMTKINVCLMLIDKKFHCAYGSRRFVLLLFIYGLENTLTEASFNRRKSRRITIVPVASNSVVLFRVTDNLVLHSYLLLGYIGHFWLCSISNRTSRKYTHTHTHTHLHTYGKNFNKSSK